MVTGVSGFEDVPLFELMLEARGGYAEGALTALASAEYDDVPRHGGLVLAALHRGRPQPEFVPQSEAVRFLRVTKQTSSQLIDTLVVRGYLERAMDPVDRRRMMVRLTERGWAAATVVHEALDEVEQALTERLTAEELNGLKAGLAMMAEIRRARDG